MGGGSRQTGALDTKVSWYASDTTISKNGRNVRLELALRRTSQVNMDLGVSQETKFMGGIYTRILPGYTMIATIALTQGQGGVGVLYCKLQIFQVKDHQNFEPNALSFQLEFGGQH